MAGPAIGRASGLVSRMLTFSQKMKPELKAVLLDVDGTLADTEEIHRQAFNRAFAEAGLDWIWGRDLYHELLAVTGGKERIRYYLDHHRPDSALPADLNGLERCLCDRGLSA